MYRVDVKIYWMIRNFPFFACFWLDDMLFPRVYLRVNWPQTAFTGQLGILYWVAKEIVRYCEELTIVLTRNKQIFSL